MSEIVQGMKKGKDSETKKEETKLRMHGIWTVPTNTEEGVEVAGRLSTGTQSETKLHPVLSGNQNPICQLCY